MTAYRDDLKRNVRFAFALFHADGRPVGRMSEDEARQAAERLAAWYLLTLTPSAHQQSRHPVREG